MRARLILLALATGPLGVAQVTTVPFSESKDVVPAFDSSGAIALPVARLKIDVTYHGGKKERDETTVLWHPQTGHYLWHLMTQNPNIDETGLDIKAIRAQEEQAYADASALIDFAVVGPSAKAWAKTAGSLDDAVTASLNEIQQNVPAQEGRSWQMDYKYVPVFGLPLGVHANVPAGYQPLNTIEFNCPPRLAVCPPNGTKIVLIAKQGNNFRLVLRNGFDVEVIVDQKLDLVSARQLTQPKTEQPLRQPLRIPVIPAPK
ncbi:MAG TPA: hypothetical protein VMI94_22490 [Bryobacteraceae bacterium]|nr:hypothetical protein [Bryobacteraceae bacterium]